MAAPQLILNDNVDRIARQIRLENYTVMAKGFPDPGKRDKITVLFNIASIIHPLYSLIYTILMHRYTSEEKAKFAATIRDMSLTAMRLTNQDKAEDLEIDPPVDPLHEAEQLVKTWEIIYADERHIPTTL